MGEGADVGDIRTDWQKRMGVGEQRRPSRSGATDGFGRFNMVDRSVPEIGHVDRREWRRGSKLPGKPMVWGAS